MGSSHLFAIYFPFVDFKFHEGLYLVYLTFHMQAWGCTLGRVLKGMIFILNLNPTSLSLVQKEVQVRVTSLQFEYLIPICFCFCFLSYK